MANHEVLDVLDEKNFSSLFQVVTELQSLACDVGIERQEKKSSLSREEHDRSMDNNEEDTLKIIKQTSDVARRAMILIVRGLQTYALTVSRRAKCFNNASSAVSFIRGLEGANQAPKHLLLQWEKNMILIDLFTSDIGLYCNKRIAQDMFDICMETFDWLRSQQ